MDPEWMSKQPVGKPFPTYTHANTGACQPNTNPDADGDRNPDSDAQPDRHGDLDPHSRF